MTSETLALVESPAQLLNVVELAHASRADDHGELRIAVLAPSLGRSREQLRAVVALAREDGLSVSWHEPRSGGASVARTVRNLLAELGKTRRLVVGDPFSGVLQILVGLVRPTDVTIVDDGTATLEFVRQWAAGEALHRWHQPFVELRPGVTGAARQQIAANLRRRLAPEAGTRLRLFTCMPLRDAGLESAGVEVQRNSYAWLKGRWSDPDVRDGVDLVGTSLVESGVVDAGRYLAGVGRLVAQQGVTRYLAHRREADDKLAQIRAFGVEVALPRLPLEIEARQGRVNATLISFPSTVVHTLPVVLADTRVRTFVHGVPDDWYAPGVDPAAEAFLRRVTTSALGSHPMAAVAC
ncbi:MAG TPA: hypothetical protein VGC37_18160 [Friedmanniella sp.]